MAKRITLNDANGVAEEHGGRCLSGAYENMFALMLWECKCGNTWKASLNNVKNNKSWCPICAYKKNGDRAKSKDGLSKAIAAAEKHGGICLSNEYTGMSHPMRWQCKSGHEWSSKLAAVLRGHWCFKCARNIPTIKDMRNLAKLMGGFCLSSKYIDSHHDLMWKCRNESHKEWHASSSNIKKGTWCPECAYDLRRLTIRDCQACAEKNRGECISAEYKNARTKLLWQCSAGHTFEMTFDAVKNVGQWCPKCAGVAKLDISLATDIAISRGGKCLSAKYINNKTKLKWECRCGNIFEAPMQDVKNKNQWCPKCSQPGKSQKLLYEILKRMFPNYTLKYNYRGFDWLRTSKFGKQEIDIFIEGIRIAVEYDGAQHFKIMRYGNAKKRLEKLKLIKKRDRIKNAKIKKHKSDVAYFIRIKYTEKITEDLIVSKLKDVGFIYAH